MFHQSHVFLSASVEALVGENEVTMRYMSETLSREIRHALSAVLVPTVVNRSFGQALIPVLGVGLKAH